MFYVWQRSDGKIGYTAYKPKNWHNAGQQPVTFEILKISAVWDRALVEYIEELFQTQGLICAGLRQPISPAITI